MPADALTVAETLALNPLGFDEGSEVIEITLSVALEVLALIAVLVSKLVANVILFNVTSLVFAERTIPLGSVSTLLAVARVTLAVAPDTNAEILSVLVNVPLTSITVRFVLLDAYTVPFALLDV